MTVETANFEFVHGRKPRGFGNWAFGPVANTPVDQVRWFDGWFSEAAKKAVKAAKAAGEHTVHVQS